MSNMYANTEQPNAQLDQLRSELPTHESASDADFKPTHGGVGSLPGGRDENDVARLPDERMQTNAGQSQGYMSQTVPGTAEPVVPQQGNNRPYDTSRMQEVSRQQDTTDSSVPGVASSDPHIQPNQQDQSNQSNQPPSNAQQTEGQQGHHRKPSLGQRMKQGFKNMTSDIKKM